MDALVTTVQETLERFTETSSLKDVGYPLIRLVDLVGNWIFRVRDVGQIDLAVNFAFSKIWIRRDKEDRDATPYIEACVKEVPEAFKWLLSGWEELPPESGRKRYQTNHIRYLAFEGGGAKCIAFCRALQKMNEMGLLENVSGYAGSSGGAIVGGLLAAGFKPEELCGRLISLTFKDVQPGICGIIANAIWGVPFHYGVLSMDDFREWYGDMLCTKVSNPDITFGELFREHGGRELYITGFNLTQGHGETYSHQTTPNMIIRDAVAISASLPFVFQAIERDGDLLVDGGLLNNYPLYIFGSHVNMDQVLGMKLMAEGEEPETERIFMGEQKITGLFSYTKSLVNAMLYQIERLHIKADYWERTICIPTGNVKATDFNMQTEKRRALMCAGYDAACDFFNEPRPTRQGDSLRAIEARERDGDRNSVHSD